MESLGEALGIVQPGPTSPVVVIWRVTHAKWRQTVRDQAGLTGGGSEGRIVQYLGSFLIQYFLSRTRFCQLQLVGQMGFLCGLAFDLIMTDTNPEPSK